MYHIYIQAFFLQISSSIFWTYVHSKNVRQRAFGSFNQMSSMTHSNKCLIMHGKCLTRLRRILCSLNPQARREKVKDISKFQDHLRCQNQLLRHNIGKKHTYPVKEWLRYTFDRTVWSGGSRRFLWCRVWCRRWGVFLVLFIFHREFL